jgi:hypothetical protein
MDKGTYACRCWTGMDRMCTAAGFPTLGLLPLGHRRDSSLTAVYKPPKPPPRMHTRGACPVLPAVLEYAAVDTDRCSKRCLNLPALTARAQGLLDVGGAAAGAMTLRAGRALPATGICERQMPLQQRCNALRAGREVDSFMVFMRGSKRSRSFPTGLHGLADQRPVGGSGDWCSTFAYGT